MNLTVTTPGGTSTAVTYTYANVPAVIGVSPSSGPVAGGSSVIITGSSFTAATAVVFGTIPAASYTVNSSTQITAISPAGAAAAVDITVATAGGTSAVNAGDHFTFIGKSSVTLTSSADPSSYGQAVTLTATVAASGGNPTGTVVFRDGSTVLFTGTLAAQITSYTTASLSVGQHAISVIYAGDNIFTSGSAGLIQTVDPAVTTPAKPMPIRARWARPVSPARQQPFRSPGAATVDSVNNHLFIADTGNQRVQVLDTGTLAVVATIGTPGASGSDNAHLNAPKGVGFDPASGPCLRRR
ncbi:MAG: Ig-like domain repeat protein [Aliidongia sp.]